MRKHRGMYRIVMYSYVAFLACRREIFVDLSQIHEIVERIQDNKMKNGFFLTALASKPITK